MREWGRTRKAQACGSRRARRRAVVIHALVQVRGGEMRHRNRTAALPSAVRAAPECYPPKSGLTCRPCSSRSSSSSSAPSSCPSAKSTTREAWRPNLQPIVLLRRWGWVSGVHVERGSEGGTHVAAGPLLWPPPPPPPPVPLTRWPPGLGGGAGLWLGSRTPRHTGWRPVHPGQADSARQRGGLQHGEARSEEGGCPQAWG